MNSARTSIALRLILRLQPGAVTTDMWERKPYVDLHQADEEFISAVTS